MHGRLSAILHEDSPLFAGIPREFQAVRYHSLCVEQPLPAALEAIAWTSDGVLMAVAHRTRPQWGVQFHPESICTEYGRRLLANFRDLTRRVPARGRGRGSRRGFAARAGSRATGSRAGRGCRVKVRRLDSALRRRARLRAPLRRKARRPFGSTAARSTSGPASPSWAPPAGRSAAKISYDVSMRASCGSSGRRARKRSRSRSSTT